LVLYYSILLDTFLGAFETLLFLVSTRNWYCRYFRVRRLLWLRSVYYSPFLVSTSRTCGSQRAL